MAWAWRSIMPIQPRPYNGCIMVVYLTLALVLELLLPWWSSRSFLLFECKYFEWGSNKLLDVKFTWLTTSAQLVIESLQVDQVIILDFKVTRSLSKFATLWHLLWLLKVLSLKILKFGEWTWLQTVDRKLT